MPRAICAGRLTTRNIARFDHARNRISTATTWIANRAQDTNCGAIPSSTRYLAQVSRQEKIMQAATTSTIAEAGVAESVWLMGEDKSMRRLR